MVLALLLAVPVLPACEGETGATGPAGPAGPAGPEGSTGSSCTVTDNTDGTQTITCGDSSITITPGKAGVSTADVDGTVSSSLGGAAEGVTVSTSPDVGVTATTDANGQYSMTLPAGVYTFTFSSDDYESKDVADISLVAGGTATIDVTLTRVNPLVAKGATVYLAGFGKSVDLDVTVTGDTGTLTYAWTQKSGPTTVTLTGANTKTPSFTTGTFDAIVSGGKVANLARHERAGIMAITNNQMAEMSYVFEVTVSDGTFTTKASATVQPASRVSATKNFPKGLIAIANDVTAGSYAWTLTKPSGSSATLNDATTRNPWFIPDVEGDYTLTNGSTTTIPLTAASWKGVESNCKGCHENTGDQYAEWSESGHAEIFRGGIDGEVSDHYSASCIGCHTLGNDPSAVNGGFDDVAASEGWTFPSTLEPGNWDALPDSLKNLGSIQCESCHGPGSRHNGNTANISVSWDAATCGYCHDAPTHHDKYPLWAQSGHANLELAMADGTTDARGTSAAHCGRCHTGQGFAAWSEQILTTGNTGNIAKPDGSAADIAYLDSLGLDAAHVQSQTCQTCHEPHGLGLRVDGSEAMPLPAGFTAVGLGEGTLCITCHNSRNGLHDDAHALTSYSAPHTASQGDVFMGKNAYFVSGLNVSAHATIEDACVTCHVRLIPTSVNTANDNHTFRADTSICGNCHGEGVNGEGLMAQVEQGLEDLAATAGSAVQAKLAAIVATPSTYAVRAYNEATGAYSSSSSSDVVITEAPTAVAVEEVHGQMGLLITLPTAITINYTDGSSTTGTEVLFQLGSLKDAGGNAVFAANSDLVKSLWNYYLIEADNTKGIHNPSFVLDVINTTAARLAASP